MTDYVVIYEQGEDGAWGAYLPDVPGCIALGDSRAEVAKNIREGLDLYVDELRRSGQSIPDARSVADVMSVERSAAA